MPHHQTKYQNEFTTTQQIVSNIAYLFMKLDTYLEDNSDDNSLDIQQQHSVQTEIRYKYSRDLITQIILCYAIDFDIPIINFMNSLIYTSQPSLKIDSTQQLLKQLQSIKQLEQINQDTYLQQITNQTYTLQQLNNIITTFEQQYKHYINKSQPLAIYQLIKIIYDQRNKLIDKLHKLFQDNNLLQLIQNTNIPNDSLWKNNRKDYEEYQLPIVQTLIYMKKLYQFSLTKQEEETHATGKMNRKKNQMIRIVRKIIKKRRPKTQNEQFCTSIQSRRFIKRLFQLLLNRQESYPEIFYCLTIKFEKKTADKIQFTLNNRFKSYIENDSYIHTILNEELIRKGHQSIKLNGESINMEQFFPCFNLDLQQSEVSEAKVVYEMIVQVYEQREQHKLRLYPIFNCTKYKFLEQQIQMIDTINKYQTPQFLKFKSIVEDIKYFLDTNKIVIQQEILQKKEKMETKLEN